MYFRQINNEREWGGKRGRINKVEILKSFNMGDYTYSGLCLYLPL